MRRRSKRGERYYYRYPDDTEEPLGSDYALALERWKEIETAPLVAGNGFSAIADAFEREYVPTKKPKTQREYKLGLARLRKVFGDARLETIKPGNIGKLKRTLRDVPTQFDRLRALLSIMWNWAREGGPTTAPNPCMGVHGYGASRRDVYVTSEMYYAVYDRAEPALQDWMDLSVVLGRRVADVLALSRTQIRDGAIVVKHAKTGKTTRIPIENDLQVVLDRIMARIASPPEQYRASTSCRTTKANR